MLLSGLRPRLVFLVLLAVLPVTGVLVATVGRERAHMETIARGGALGAASQVAAIHAEALSQAEGALVSFSDLAAVIDADAEACDRAAEALRLHDASYANVGAVSPNGDVFCSAVPLRGPTSLADRGYIRGALTTGRTTLGDYQIGRITGRSSVNIGVPARDARGEIRAVVFVALDVAALGRTTLDTTLPDGAVIRILDRNGVILARHPALDGLAGTSALGGSAALDALFARAPREGAVVDDEQHILALAPLAPRSAAWVLVDVPKGALLADADLTFRKGLFAVALVTLAATLAAWWLGEVMLVRRVGALSDLAARLADGDLTARSSLRHGRDEIGRLARSLDVMAEAVDAQTRRNRQILASAAEGIVTLDLTGRVTSANPAAALLLGWTPEELVGRNLHTLVHGDSHPRDRCPLDRPARDSAVVPRASDEFIRKDGTVIPVQTIGSPIVDHGEVGGVVLVFADHRQQRLLEEQLQQAQKMEVVGRLSGGVAHDFNNLLTAILGYGELLRDRLGPDRTHRELDEMIKSGHRAAALTRQLLTFSRAQPYEPRVIDPNALVRGTEKLLWRLVGEDVKLTLELDPAVRNVLADPGQLEQVLMNLAVNARDAVTRGGALRLSTRALPNGAVEIAVADDGAGMDASLQARIFDPFFTTKSTGTGLGLSIVRDAVLRAGGSIDVDSAPGQGTTFRIALAGTSDVIEPVWDADSTVVAGTETVLIVEDDASVRTFARRALETVGYLVIEAVDGEDAEACADAQIGTIHLVLTDLVMPGIDGMSLAARLQVGHPDLVALFMTGYAPPVGPGGGPRRDVLLKPFGAQQLLSRVRKALDGALDQTSDMIPRPPGLPTG